MSLSLCVCDLMLGTDVSTAVFTTYQAYVVRFKCLSDAMPTHCFSCCHDCPRVYAFAVCLSAFAGSPVCDCRRRSFHVPIWNSECARLLQRLTGCLETLVAVSSFLLALLASYLMVQAWIALAGTSIDETGKKLEQDRQPAVGNITFYSQPLSS